MHARRSEPEWPLCLLLNRERPRRDETRRRGDLERMVAFSGLGGGEEGGGVLWP